MAYEEYTDDLDIEEEKRKIAIPVPSLFNTLERSHLCRSLRDLLIYPDIFFSDLFSRPPKLGIPLLIIVLSCILHAPYELLTNPHRMMIANPFGFLGQLYLLYGPWRTIVDQNIVSWGNDPLSLFLLLVNDTFILLYPFFQVLAWTLFFLIIMHIYAKTPFAPLKQTFIWVTYGMVPFLISGAIFIVKDPITKPFQDLVMMKFTDVSAALHMADHIDIPNIVYALFALSIFSYIDLVIGILFLYWSAKIWHAGLSAAEILPAKKTRNIIVFVAGAMISIRVASFIFGVLWRYHWFFG